VAAFEVLDARAKDTARGSFDIGWGGLFDKIGIKNKNIGCRLLL
jgi:hypothetical protein